MIDQMMNMKKHVNNYLLSNLRKKLKKKLKMKLKQVKFNLLNKMNMRVDF
jgi:hypothetical protein